MTPIQPLFGRTREEQERRLAEMVPMRCVGTVDQVAAAILFLSLPESAYTTGAEIGMDGGWAQGVCR
jgi:NAD(P)-dependent dehydrogenase (short-subunit alcohol dehydrogenase family)